MMIGHGPTSLIGPQSTLSRSTISLNASSLAESDKKEQKLEEWIRTYPQILAMIFLLLMDKSKLDLAHSIFLELMIMGIRLWWNPREADFLEKLLHKRLTTFQICQLGTRNTVELSFEALDILIVYD